MDNYIEESKKFKKSIAGCNVVECLLQEWGLEDMIPIFEARQIDYEALKLMTENDMSELFPLRLLGRKIIFRHKLQLWQLSNGKNSLLTDPDKVSRTISWINKLPTPTPQTPPTSLPTTPSSLPTPGQTASSTPTGSIRAPVIMPFGNTKLNLESILESNTKGKIIMTIFKEKQKLNINERRKLVDAISDYFICRNEPMSLSMFRLISGQIESLFSGEKKETYFIPKDDRKGIQGLLANRYYNATRSYKKAGFLLRNYRKRKLGADANTLVATTTTAMDTNEVLKNNDLIDDISPDEYDDCKTWLQFNTEPWPVVIDKWKISSNRRIKAMLQVEPSTLDNLTVFTEWPILMEQNGHNLIDIDFNQMFPNSVLNLPNNWGKFIVNIKNIFKEKIKDAFNKVYLKDYNKQKISENSRNCLCILLLCVILNHRATIKTNTGPWRLSITDTQRSMIAHVKSNDEVASTIETYENHYKALGLSLQPFIIAIGPELTQLTEFHVYYKRLHYTFDTLLKSLDITFKLHFCLNIPYAIESKHVWLFIQQYLYRINTSKDIKSANVITLMSDLDKM